MLDEVDLSGITDPEARRIIGVLLNAIETLTAENQVLRAENQRLRDENNRLKGEQGKPTLLPSKRAPTDHASERERRAGRPARHPADPDKRSLLHIDRTEEREVDPALLPPDAERKGYAEFVVQDVALHTDTVLFRCARWYAASTRRSYQAPLPEGYHNQGHYGPGLKALALQRFRWDVLRWCILAEESSDKTVTSARLNPQFGVKIVVRPYSRWVAECLPKAFHPSQ